MSIDPWPIPETGVRVQRSVAVVEACAAEFRAWFDAREQQDSFAVFAAHFTILRGVLEAMVAAVGARLAGVDEGDRARAHARCRDIDRRTDVVRRLFHWYREKYDQRTDPLFGSTVRAADAVVRSCWTSPFTVAEVIRPSGPLTYLDDRYDAATCPRGSVPVALRSTGDDDMIGPFLRRLPIPVVALPAVGALEPWWLVLAAHETGHLVYQDLDPGLDKTVRAAVGAAVDAAPGPHPQAVELWPNWSAEMFADAFAVACVGASAGPAVADLEYGPPRTLVKVPTDADLYPPAAVRLALHGELARAAGLHRIGPGAHEVDDWIAGLPDGAVAGPAATEARAHLRLVPAVAAALLAVRVNGSTLLELCGFAADRFRPGGEVAAWRAQLTVPNGFLADRGSPTAASSGIAAAVELWTGPWPESRPDPPTLALARFNLLRLLDGSGPPDTLAGPIRSGVDVGALARTHADLLFDVELGQEDG